MKVAQFKGSNGKTVYYIHVRVQFSATQVSIQKQEGLKFERTNVHFDILTEQGSFKEFLSNYCEEETIDRIMDYIFADESGS